MQFDKVREWKIPIWSGHLGRSCL